MIAGYAVAGQMLGEPRYRQAAVQAADFLLNHLRTKEGRLLRAYGSRPGAAGAARLDGYLDDYAFLTYGLLCLHDATGEPKWLDEARSLTDMTVKLFHDEKGGGFFYTSREHEQLFARSKDQYDGVQPSGNSIAAQNLVRLWTKTHEPRYRDLAERSLRTFAGPLKANPASLTAMARGVAQFLEVRDAPGTGEAVVKEEPAPGGDAKRSDSVVSATASVEPKVPGADGKQVVTVDLKIESGWHIYANPPGVDDLAPVQTTVNVSAKVKPRQIKIDYPEGKLIDDPAVGKYKVYEDKAAIKATVVRGTGDTGPLEITIRFQACNEKTCLLPAIKKLTVP